MLDFTTTSETDIIIRRAHEMRAQAMANMLRSFLALFRRKPAKLTNAV